MTSDLPYLVVITGDLGPVDAFGPIRAINAESAAEEALDYRTQMDFDEFGIEVYPLSVSPDGEVESETIDPEVIRR